MLNIEGMSIEELKQLQHLANDRITELQHEKRADAYRIAKEAAESVGLSLEELMEYGQTPVKKERRRVAAQYRSKTNPDNTWTGRGKQPRWLIEEISATGQSLESFKIAE